MADIECSREQDVLDALAAGRWPDRAATDLASHLAACAICRDVAVVAGELRAAQELAHAEVHVPSSGVVWWRAQVRARREAALQAARPITLAQIFGACVGLAGLAAFVLVFGPWLRLALQPIWTLLAAPLGSISIPSVTPAPGWWWIPVLTLVTWAVVPIAVYLTAREE